MSAAPPLEPGAPSVRPCAARVWLHAARPRTLGASAIPVLVGTAVAAREGAARLDVLVECLLAATLLQIAANLVNDASDFLAGIDGATRRGPERVTQAGLRSPRSVQRAAVLCLGFASLIGVHLILIGGALILAIGLLAGACAVGYSAGPLRLASRGLGELAAFVFFGAIAVVGTDYLHTGQLSGLALVVSLPIGALIANVMLANNLRDLESDRACAKRTLVVRLGAAGGRKLFSLTMAFAFLAPVGLALGFGLGWGPLLSWLSLPVAVSLRGQLARARSGEELDRVLVGSARLHALFGVLLALGLLR
ncbi:MAG: 1,4-dihydroxy-2-naphthoate octaprenyltransferase [Myxococcota bacterium]